VSVILCSGILGPSQPSDQFQALVMEELIVLGREESEEVERPPFGTDEGRLAYGSRWSVLFLSSGVSPPRSKDRVKPDSHGPRGWTPRWRARFLSGCSRSTCHSIQLAGPLLRDGAYHNLQVL
jgi:hypothetical protein